MGRKPPQKHPLSKNKKNLLLLHPASQNSDGLVRKQRVSQLFMGGYEESLDDIPCLGLGCPSEREGDRRERYQSLEISRADDAHPSRLSPPLMARLQDIVSKLGEVFVCLASL